MSDNKNELIAIKREFRNLNTILKSNQKSTDNLLEKLLEKMDAICKALESKPSR